MKTHLDALDLEENFTQQFNSIKAEKLWLLAFGQEMEVEIGYFKKKFKEMILKTENYTLSEDEIKKILDACQIKTSKILASDLNKIYLHCWCNPSVKWEILKGISLARKHLSLFCYFK